jgi:hypothetical protein
MPNASEKENFSPKIGDIELEVDCNFEQSVEINRKKKLLARQKVQQE